MFLSLNGLISYHIIFCSFGKLYYVYSLSFYKCYRVMDLFTTIIVHIMLGYKHLLVIHIRKKDFFFTTFLFLILELSLIKAYRPNSHQKETNKHTWCGSYNDENMIPPFVTFNNFSLSKVGVLSQSGRFVFLVPGRMFTQTSGDPFPVFSYLNVTDSLHVSTSLMFKERVLPPTPSTNSLSFPACET